jgi:ADP-ribose pyrophosphatase YjhB (NUDIX family)
MPPGHVRLLAIGVFRSGDRVLVARGTDPATGAPFYRPLGGGVEFGERAAEALGREIREELGMDIGEPQLLGVLESLFEYAGRPRHEVVFVFDARFRDPAVYGRDELAVVEAGAGWEPARWVPLEHFAAGPGQLVPDGLLALLRGAPAPAGPPGPA